MGAQAAKDGPITWQDVACPLCAARAEAPVLEVPWPGGDRPFRLVRCRRCGLGYLNPRPDEAGIARFYTDAYESYHAAEGRARRPARWRRALERLVMAGRYGTPPAPLGLGARLLALLASPWLDPGPDSLTAIPYVGQGRLLDYGCGTGWLAHRLRQFGWDAVGMDFSPYAAEQARRLFGVPVLVGTLPHPAVAPESFDVITMGQVLEHVHRPHEVIAAAAQALRPGGYLAVAVPNFESWAFHALREDWWCLQLPIHLSHFTPATLRTLLQAHGLEVRRQRMVRRPGWMRRSLAAARRSGNPGLPAWLRRLGGSRLVANALATWSTAAGRGDCLLAVAYKPAAARRAA